MKRKLIMLSGGFILSTLIVVILYMIADYNSRHPNGFWRSVQQHRIDFVERFNIKNNSWYLTGRYDNRVLLRNTKIFNELLTVDFSLKDTGFKILSWPDTIKVFNGSNIVVDSPMVYVTDGVTPNIFSENLNTRQVATFSNPPFFTMALPVSANSFILRFADSSSNNLLLKCASGLPLFYPQKNILTRQIDGFFSTDGTFVKVPGTASFVYTYYYRNQFIVIDSSLNVIFEGKTIDTTTWAHIKIGTITSEGQTTMSAPPLFVNKETCASRDWLFVRSMLKADNETESDFKNVSVIDVYSLKNGKYAFSVYIPDFNGFKIRDMKIFDNALFVLVDRYIYKYKLNF